MTTQAAQRLQWVLTALDAYDQGLPASAAIRKADADSAARARPELLAFLSSVGEHQSGRSLAMRLRRHVLAQAVAAVRSLGRILLHLTGTDPGGAQLRSATRRAACCMRSATPRDADRARSASRFGGA
jgi:hypothetical protein